MALKKHAMQDRNMSSVESALDDGQSGHDIIDKPYIGQERCYA